MQRAKSNLDPNRNLFGSFGTTLVVVLLAFLILMPARSTRGQSLDFKMMSFNVWGADNQTAKLAEIIQAGGADIVGLQEMNNGDGQKLANQLGWHYHQQSSGDIQIVSRFAIVDQSADNRGAKIEFTPGHNIWLFNSHLAPYPYQPYDLRDNPNLTEAQLIAGANGARGSQIDAYMNSIGNTTTAGDRVFFTGDFNEPSHLDWTAAAAAASPRTFDKKVFYPTSEKVVNAGFSDSFRVARPNEVTDTGYTWTPGYPPPNLNPDEVHDRIDFVYYRGPSLTTTSSQNVGLTTANPNTHIAVAGYNSDHRAVVSGINAAGLIDSTLTFSRLAHNPGNDSALNAGNYGDRLAPTPNITVAFSNSGSGTWDTYDGDNDGGIDNWEVGVAQLQGDGAFDLAFNADAGFGVIVDSFDLVDYANFAGGHSVNWELWSGLANSGSLLTSGSQTIAANGIQSVLTNYSTTSFGQLTLRLQHITGDTTDLALDNVRFRQVTAVPEPTAAVLLALTISWCGLTRRRKEAVL